VAQHATPAGVLVRRGVGQTGQALQRRRRHLPGVGHQHKPRQGLGARKHLQAQARVAQRHLFAHAAQLHLPGHHSPRHTVMVTQVVRRDLPPCHTGLRQQGAHRQRATGGQGVGHAHHRARRGVEWHPVIRKGHQHTPVVALAIGLFEANHRANAVRRQLAMAMAHQLGIRCRAQVGERQGALAQAVQHLFVAVKVLKLHRLRQQAAQVGHQRLELAHRFFRTAQGNGAQAQRHRLCQGRLPRQQRPCPPAPQTPHAPPTTHTGS